MKLRLRGRLPFEIQVGALDYGFPVQGLLGLDFLIAAKAVIDLGSLQVRASEEA